jgi:hypothetical protein
VGKNMQAPARKLNYVRAPLMILFFSLVCPYSLNRQEISKLSQIPDTDRAKIEKLLSFLMWDEGFAYVLFGNKPISICSQDKTVPPYYLELYQSPVLELEALWNTWEKYSHLFPMNEFIFLTESNDKRFNVYLLKKSNVLNVIEKNPAIFQEKTGLCLNSNDMFNHIVMSGNLFKIGLNKSQALYGILLGYGTENSLGFENYFSVKRDYLPESLAHIKVTGRLSLPCFASFSKEETEKIMAGYQQQRQEILTIYSNNDFLETTINQLTVRN